MASSSSLLKSAAATKKKVQAYQDSIVAFGWSNSAQTYDEYLQYSNYLQDKADKTTDPAQSLSYQKDIIGARRSYTTNEIQRQQNAILEGTATTSDKMSTVKYLYYQAVDNGDYNLAQNLISQWDGLNIKLQNEAQVNADKFAASSAKEKTKFMDSLTKGVNDVTLPTGQTVTPLAALSQIFQETGDTVGVLKAAQETMDALRVSLIDQYNNATTQEEVDALESKYGTGLENIDSVLKINIGGKNLTNQDVINGIANDQLNNPKYGLEAVHNDATGQNEFKLKTNNVDQLDYVRQVDPATGEDVYTTATIRTDQNKLNFGTSDQGRGLGTQLTNEGFVIGDKGQTGDGKTVKRDDSQSIENRLAALGIVAKTNGTTLMVKLPGENVERQATIQPDGSIRYYGDNGYIEEIGLVDRNLGSDALPQLVRAGQPRTVAPDEISDFGSTSAFGGQLSAPSQQGQKYISDILGKTATPNSITANKISVGNNFSGNGTGATSGLLQSAAAQKEAIQLQAQRKAMEKAQALALQSTNNFNLGQTPVQQFASNGVLKSQLNVSIPAPTPVLKIAADTLRGGDIANAPYAQKGGAIKNAPDVTSGGLRVR